MISIQPIILEKDGKKAFAILTYDEFSRIQDELQNFEDLKELREAKESEKNVSGLSLSEARKEWGC